MEEHMRARKQIRDGRIGEADVHTMKVLDVIETAFEMTQELCPDCPTQSRAT